MNALEQAERRNIPIPVTLVLEDALPEDLESFLAALKEYGFLTLADESNEWEVVVELPEPTDA